MRSCRARGAGAFSPALPGLCSDSARGRPTCSGSLGWLGRGGAGGPTPGPLPPGRLGLISAIPSWPLPHQMLLHLFAQRGERRGVCPLWQREGRPVCLRGARVPFGWGDPTWGCWEGWGGPVSCPSPHSWSRFLGDLLLQEGRTVLAAPSGAGPVLVPVRFPLCFQALLLCPLIGAG